MNTVEAASDPAFAKILINPSSYPQLILRDEMFYRSYRQKEQFVAKIL